MKNGDKEVSLPKVVRADGEPPKKLYSEDDILEVVRLGMEARRSTEQLTNLLAAAVRQAGGVVTIQPDELGEHLNDITLQSDQDPVTKVVTLRTIEGPAPPQLTVEQ